MDIKTYKQRKLRGASVDDVIKSLSSNAHAMESIAVVAMYRNGEIDTAHSGDNDVELIGMLEVAKTELIQNITGA